MLGANKRYLSSVSGTGKVLLSFVPLNRSVRSEQAYDTCSGIFQPLYKLLSPLCSTKRSGCTLVFEEIMEAHTPFEIDRQVQVEEISSTGLHFCQSTVVQWRLRNSATLVRRVLLLSMRTK